MSVPFLLFQKRKIFINRGSAQITNPCQLAQIEVLIFERGIMAKKNRWNIVCGQFRSADFRALGSGVRHSRAHARAYKAIYVLKTFLTCKKELGNSELSFVPYYVLCALVIAYLIIIAVAENDYK